MTAALRIRALTTEDWPVLETLFGANGACGGCWCMYWRVPSTGKYWDEHKGAENKKALRRLVQAGDARGLLAFAGNEAAGWCSVGPREDFAYLKRARKIGPAPGPSTWSVTCFYIPRPWRNEGIARQLLIAAVGYARSEGARYLEGYPVKPYSGGRRIPDAFAHTGLSRLFERAGFTAAADAGSRTVYRIAF